MKKIIVYTVFAALLVFAASCKKKELEIWDSATLDYSGKYWVRIMTEDTVMLDYGGKMLIYNTAQDKSNNFWLDVVYGKEFAIRAKCAVSGNKSNFKTDASYNSLPDLEKPGRTLSRVDHPVDKADSVFVLDSMWLRAAIIEGEILEDAVTTPGGNKADSLRINLKVYRGNLSFKSFELPKEQWIKPDVPEYSWKLEKAEHVPSLDKDYVLSGRGYTGFEDDF